MNMQLKPTIIGIAEGTHYLVGVTDAKDNFTALPALNEVAICASLSEAKQLLRNQRVDTAQLTLQSAYDEMCGLPSSSVVNQTIHF
jgi:predicted negative regulator of RcsB-dependent stress response